MKLNLLKFLLILFCVSPGIVTYAQNAKNTSASQPAFPASFTITKKEMNELMSKKEKTTIRSKNNKYLDRALVTKNVSNGDMRFLRLQLSYFKTGFLTIQINGSYSTQVFVLSENKSVFYKGRLEKGNVILTKCEEDEIVSE